mgnify:CR=1 FL=1
MYTFSPYRSIKITYILQVARFAWNVDIGRKRLYFRHLPHYLFGIDHRKKTQGYMDIWTLSRCQVIEAMPWLEFLTRAIRL